MIISQYGKIIRTESKQIRECQRSSQGVRLLHLEPGDKVAATSVIPPEEVNGNGNGNGEPTLLQ
jgi:DNA gyrase subunit A